MVAMRCGSKALLVSFGVVALYRMLALALVDAGAPPLVVALAAGAGMATFGYRVSRRWASRRPGGWALVGAAVGINALPVLLFHAERARLASAAS